MFNSFAQKGQIAVIAAIFVVMIGAIFLTSFKLPLPSDSSSQTSQGSCPTIPASGVQIQLPPYDFPKGGPGTGPDVGFTLVRKNVLMDAEFFPANGSDESEHLKKLKTISVTDNGEQKNYDVYYIKGGDGALGGEVDYPKKIVSKYKHPGDLTDQLYFYDFGLIFLVPQDNVSTDTKKMKTTSTDNGHKIAPTPLFVWHTDIYQQNSEIEAAHKVPDDVFSCSVDNTDNSVTFPEQSAAVDNKQLQLNYFVFDSGYSGLEWIPHCKPAIYLYPKQEMAVNVKVNTKGFLTYTDPKYPAGGWNVIAEPDGKLVASGKSPESRIYDYLYYESKIPDDLIEKPTKGYAVSFDQLPTLYYSILPKLGLDLKQTEDFADYWKKALPYSPYYFVGILDQKNIDSFEPLEITPKPDVVNRVRIYFQRLTEPVQVKAPELVASGKSPESSQFRVVEWGGMIKNDPNHPFTCSQ